MASIDHKDPIQIVSVYPAPVFIRAVQRPVVLQQPPKLTFTVVRVRISFYCPCARCCGRMTGITATQSSAWVPGVAADFTWLKPGTIVEIPGYGKYKIDDTGGKLKRRWWTKGMPRLDARVTYHWEARQMGIQYLDVKIFN